MGFPSAKKGIKKMIIAEILAIVSSVIATGAELLLYLATEGILDLNYISETPLLLVGLFLGLSLPFIIIVSSLIVIVGCFQASKDESEFKKAMLCMIASSTMTLIGLIFQIPNGMLYTVFTSSGMILEFFVMVFAVSGIINLSEKCERSELVRSGDVLLYILTASYLINAVNRLIIRIFELSEQSRIVAVVFGAIELILSILQHFLFLQYLAKSRKMLTEIDGDGI